MDTVKKVVDKNFRISGKKFHAIYDEFTYITKITLISSESKISVRENLQNSSKLHDEKTRDCSPERPKIFDIGIFYFNFKVSSGEK